MLLITIVTTQFVQGQNTPVKEYGFGLYSLNNFSLQYRWGTEKKLFRIAGDIDLSSSKQNVNSTTLFNDSFAINSQNNNASTKNPFNIGLGIGLSILNLKPINENFGLVFGPSFATSFYYSSSKDEGTQIDSGTSFSKRMNYFTETKNTTIRPSLGLIIGGYYSFNSKFFIYGEIRPNFYLKYEKNENTNNSNSIISNQPNTYIERTNDTDGTTFGISNLSNSNAMITFVYRIQK